MKNTVNLSKAKVALEGILTREWSFRGSAPDEHRAQLRAAYSKDTEDEIDEMTIWGNPYYLRKNAPEIRTRGTHQIILGLGNGYVGKTRIKGETTDHYILMVSAVYEPILKDTLEILRELEFDVTEHRYVGIENYKGSFKVMDNGFGFVITSDLSENGRYRVEDVKNEHFEKLVNGAKLENELADSLRILQEIYDDENQLYGIDVNDHVTDEGPQEAFRHMFCVQIDPTTNRGKLVLGDLDHVILYRE